MEDTFALSLDNDSRSHACTNCPGRFECSVLDMCLRVLDSAVLDGARPRAVPAVPTLRARIGRTGFAYPHGTRRCALANRPDTTARLVEASVTTFQSLFRPRRPPEVGVTAGPQIDLECQELLEA